MDATRHQHRVWETIFPSFDDTRVRPWPFVAEFVADLPSGSVVLDLMAGNGRHTGLLRDAGHHATWLDWSRPAAAAAKKRLPDADVVVADACALPLAAATFDAVLYVAGLHGIPHRDGRGASLRELGRVLRAGGRGLLSVWSRDAPRFRGMDLLEGPTDVTVPWRAGGHDEMRTYHLYTETSLRGALAEAGLTVRSLAAPAVASDTPDNLVAVVARP